MFSVCALLLTIGIWAGLVLVFIAMLGFMRYQAVMKGGVTHLRVVRPVARNGQLALGGAVILFLVFGLGLELQSDPNPARVLELLLWLVLAILFAVPRLGFGPAYLEIREHGLVIGGLTLMPWYELKSYAWEHNDHLTLVVQFRQYKGSYRIAAQQKQDVDRLLAQHRPAKA